MKAVYILGGIALLSNLVGFAIAGKEEVKEQQEPAAIIQKLDTSGEEKAPKIAATAQADKRG